MARSRLPEVKSWWDPAIASRIEAQRVGCAVGLSTVSIGTCSNQAICSVSEMAMFTTAIQVSVPMGKRLLPSRIGSGLPTTPSSEDRHPLRSGPRSECRAGRASRIMLNRIALRFPTRQSTFEEFYPQKCIARARREMTRLVLSFGQVQ
jgi:hypothetical protein